MNPQRAAAAILRESRFHNPSVPRPLHGVLHAIGSAVGRVEHALLTLVAKLAKVVPGGKAGVWVLLGLVVVAAIAALVLRDARRRARRAYLTAMGIGDVSALEQPDELERRAAEAHDAGRYDEAVRLRFRAGLGRLEDRGTIAPSRTTPTAQVARELRSPDFDQLAQRFDEIAYGGDDAVEADDEQARRRWPVVLGAEPTR